MARLPQPGGDNGNWGDILNDYLSQSHKNDGSLKDDSVTSSAIAPGAVTAAEIAADTITATQIADNTIQEGQLAGAVQAKLNASSTASDWNALLNKPTIIAAGPDQAAARLVIGAGTSNLEIGLTATTAKAGNYNPTKTDVGLGNVDNTSDSSKPISNATQTALDGKAATAHTHTALQLSDSTATGRSVILATDAAAARTAIGAVDSSAVATAIQNSGPKESDYVISVVGSTYYATPRPGTGLTQYSGTNFSIIMQNAVNALTIDAPNAGTRGSGGGKIHIAKGHYHFVSQVEIVGWEGITDVTGIPESQLIIEGEGYATMLLANVAGQAGFVVKNLCSFVIRDMKGYQGVNSKAWLLGDSNGAISQMSIWGGSISNIFVQSNSTVQAPIHLKNFFDIQGDRITVTSSATDGFVLENASPDTHFGNSHWNNIRSSASNGAAFKIFSSQAPWSMNLMSFSHLETNGSQTGLYTYGAQALEFGFIDFEACDTVFSIDGNTAAWPNTVMGRGITLHDGYMSVKTGGTFFKIRGSAGNLNLGGHCGLGGDLTAKLIDDTTTFQPRSEYHLRTDGPVDGSQIIVTEPKHVIDIIAYDEPVSNVGGLHGYPNKTTLASGDEFMIADSADGYRGKRTTWNQLKASMGATGARVLDIGGYYPDATFPAVNSNLYDLVKAVNIYRNITDMSAALTGTPGIGDKISYELTDNGNNWTLAWGTKFEEAPGLKLPTQLIGGQTKMTLDFRWNAESSKWRIQSMTSGKIAPSQILDSNGNTLLEMTATTSAVNYLQIKNDSTAFPGINAAGGGTNIDINLVPKGTGRVKQNGSNLITASSSDTLTNKTLTSPTLTTPRFANNGTINDNNGNEQVKFITSASAVNEVSMQNAATGGIPTIAVSGDDTDINLNLGSKGTGMPLVNFKRIQTVERVMMSTSITLGALQSHKYYVFLQAGALPTLPTAVNQQHGTQYMFKNITGSAINIATTSSQTIDGAAAPYSLAPGAKITLMSDNAGWQSI